jgi:D-sedoheptulose 7-phosphate isomerase
MTMEKPNAAMDPKEAIARIDHEIAESCRVKHSFSSELKSQIADLATRMAATLARGGAIYWIGNGGSAADAQHLAGELVARLRRSRQALSSVALTTNTSLLTSIANDDSYEEVFSRQVEAAVRPSDMLIALSTSGKSTNIVKAVSLANELGAFTVGWTGETGGALANVARLCLRVPSQDVQRVQESHITIGHIVCGIVEDTLFPS